MKTGTAGTSLAALGLLLLAACGGGGGGGPATQPGPIDPPAPTDPPAPDPIPRGSSAVPGINQIPLDRIKATNHQMSGMFAIAERLYAAYNRHTEKVRQVACDSYTVQCADSESYNGKQRNTDGTVTTKTGLAPYSSFTDHFVTTAPGHHWSWLYGQVNSMPNLKILSLSMTPGFGIDRGTLPSYLIVQGAGNQGVGENYGALYSLTQPKVDRIKGAIAADKMLLIAGWNKDANGNYIRHAQARHCRESGVSEGCLWAQFEFPGVGAGTSFSGPQVAAALASVLSVFPDTEHRQLARFAKACAKKTGNGIPVLLATQGGVGVADFTCMGSVTGALASLPTGGRADVAIQGQTVSVGGRDLTLSFASLAPFAPRLGDGATSSSDLQISDFRTSLTVGGGKEDGGTRGLGFSWHVVPTGEGKAMAVGAFEGGGFFASLAAGTREDFFGFVRGHEEGVRETRLTAGRKEAFAYVSDVRSGGGASIRSAKGRAAGLMLREAFDMGRGISLSVSAQADRFLGGEAEIGRNGASFGSMDLRPGGWSRQFNVASEIALGGARTLNLSAQLRSPDGGGEETALAASLDWRF